jgi:hypothetical protein
MGADIDAQDNEVLPPRPPHCAARACEPAHNLAFAVSPHFIAISSPHANTHALTILPSQPSLPPTGKAPPPSHLPPCHAPPLVY